MYIMELTFYLASSKNVIYHTVHGNAENRVCEGIMFWCMCIIALTSFSLTNLLCLVERERRVTLSLSGSLSSRLMPSRGTRCLVKACISPEPLHPGTCVRVNECECVSVCACECV